VGVVLWGGEGGVVGVAGGVMFGGGVLWGVSGSPEGEKGTENKKKNPETCDSMVRVLPMHPIRKDLGVVRGGGGGGGGGGVGGGGAVVCGGGGGGGGGGGWGGGDGWSGLFGVWLGF